jgi:tetraacyldisaccharide 4'-kinase
MLTRIEADIRRLNRDLVVARSVHVPVGIKTAGGIDIGLDQLRGQRVLAFCAIGNPRSFFHAVERLGGMLVGARAYDDHYRYGSREIEEIHGEAVMRGASLVLTTEKDWTKISHWTDPQGQPPLAYLAIELQITAGAEKLTALIDHLVGDIMPT